MRIELSTYVFHLLHILLHLPELNYLCVRGSGRDGVATGGSARLEGVLLRGGAERGSVQLAQELRQLLLVGDGHEGQAELDASQLLWGKLTSNILRDL